MKKKFFAIVLCMALIVTMLPFNAFAEEAEAQDMNTDISAQEVEQSDGAEDNISAAEQERDNEAEENGTVMSASVAAGSIAEVSWDDDDNAVYNVRNESDIYVSAGSESNYFSVGKMESGKFCPAEGTVDSCSITVNRNGWNESVSKNEPTWSNPLRAGGFEGCYDFDEEALYLGYNENAIFLGEDAYGAYQVTVNWTAGGTEYSTEIVLNLKPAEMLTRGYFSGNPDSWAKEAGFSKCFYAYDHIEMKDSIYRLKYAPCIDYENTNKSSTVIFSDGKHGILNFKDSNCDIEGLFAAGKSVEYKSDVTVIPMTVDYSKVTADIMDKVYTLTFADSAGNEVTCRICFEKDESVDRLEDGRLYAIGPDGTTAKDGNVYVSSVEWQLSDCVELTVKTTKTLFFGIWRAKTQQLELAEISTDELGENMSLEECEEGCYMISSDVSGSGNLKTANGETIKYTSTLPSCGVYSAPEKSDENYLTNQISLNDTGKEFYLIVDGNGIEKNELQLNISVQEAFSASYYGEDTKGDNKYFIWKITASDEFEPEDDGISVDFEVLENNKYYDSAWLYISYTIAAEQQLYWFYDDEASVDSDGMIETKAEGVQCTRIWAEANRTVTGYFAVKTESGSYKAVDSVISDSPDDLIVTKAEDGYAYSLKWVKEGSYICRATVDGKEYRIKAGFNLPRMGLYSTENRSIDSYLGDEFHYIDAADENKKEAYFYIITDTCGYELNEVAMTCGRWVRGEWKKKDVDGISIEKLGVSPFNSEEYFVYKVIVSDQYRAGGNDEVFGLVNDNGECLRDSWIRIYDSTEISQNQQLYWFYGYEASVDSDGMISTETKNAQCTEIRTRINITLTGYFAVKTAEGYKAINNVQISEGNSIILEKSEEGYLCEIKSVGIGECIIEGIEENAAYKMYIYTDLPDIGVYSTEDRSIDSYLGDEFHYIDAVKNSEDKTKAEFYVISRTYNYEETEVKVSTGAWNENGEWYSTNIKGLLFGDPKKQTIDSEDYFVCKVTVSDEYRQKNQDAWKEIALVNKSNNGCIEVCSAQIYDSTEVSEDEQLYWFDSDANIEVDSNGKLSLSSDSRYASLEEKAEVSFVFSSRVDDSWGVAGYFAVKDDKGDFYAIKNIEVTNKENTKILNSDGFKYVIQELDFGEYRFTAGKDNKIYKFNVSVLFPEMGFYKHGSISSENYIEDFSFTDAAEKNEDETKAYFYVIAEADDYGESDVKMSVGDWDEDGKWCPVIIKGLSFGDPEKQTIDSEDYFVCKVTVSNDYRSDRDIKRVALTDNKGTIIRNRGIMIYDSAKISPEQQMYWFDEENVDVNENNQIILKDNHEKVDWYDRDEQIIYTDKRNNSETGYFTYRAEDGNYYILKDVKVVGGENIDIKADGKKFCVSWTDFGEYHFECKDGDREYKFNWYVNLPYMGAYSKPEKTVDTYLDNEFHFVNAADKESDGSKAYFYIINSYSGDNYDMKAKGSYGKEIEGVSIAYDKKMTDDIGNIYHCWKVTVTKEFRKAKANVRFTVLKKDSETYWDDQYITVYGADEETRMYCLQTGVFKADEQTSLISSDYEESENYIDDEICTKDTSGDIYYFAVRKNGKYYAVDELKASDEDKVKITSFSDRSFEIRWSAFGKYQLTGTYDNKEYSMELIVELPDMGFYSSPDRSADKYLGKEMYFEDIPQKSKDKKVATAYFITPAYSSKDNIKIEVGQYKLNSDGNEMEWQAENNDGIVFSNPKEAAFGTKKYYVWEVHIGNKYELNKDYEIALINTESQGPFDLLRDIVIHNADKVTPSQQIYYFNSQDVDIVNGKIVFKEGTSDNDRMTLRTLTCGRSRVVACFAVQKNGEYYKVDIADAKGVRYSVDETSGATTLIAEKTGEYTLTAVYDGKRYYSKGTIVLPNEGFWSEPNRSDETLLKEFNYNTADENKHFYYILPKTYLNNFELSDISLTPSILSVDSTGPHFSPAPGISAIRLKEFTEQYPEYYCWEIKVGSEFRGADNIYMWFKAGDNEEMTGSFWVIGYKTYDGNILEGTVTSSDNTDNAEMILYRVDKLEELVEGEYTDSKAEAYIKSDIISNSHYGSSVTEKGRITGTGGIYSQTYKFVNVTEGEYKLVVYKPGYGVHIENVTVSDSTVTRDIKLSLLGDANGDGKVRIGDKAVLARAIAGWTGYESLLNRDAADINGDGLIKNDDLMILSRHLAGWLGYSQLEYGRQQIKSE